MTACEIEALRFVPEEVETRRLLGGRFSNWPVVYTISNHDSIYIGETLNVAARMRQHLATPEKQDLQDVRVILHDGFNKSVCLDFESTLIRLFAGDGKFQVRNRNDGIIDANYFDRERYQPVFDEIFLELKSAGLFTRSIPEIENSDLFKLSPYKALNQDQAAAVEDILSGLFEDLAKGRTSTLVIQGEPGTGKTVVGIYLMKLLSDIAHPDTSSVTDEDAFFADFFTPGHSELLTGLSFAMVVPQQSLRKSIQRVFQKTPGLCPTMVLSPFDVGESTTRFDLLIVDEAHRLNQRANQPSGVQNKKFSTITERLYGTDDLTKTQLDWIRSQSRHQLFLLDQAQSVRPSDLPSSTITPVVQVAAAQHRLYPLASQMRVLGGDDYIAYVRAVLSDHPPEPRGFPGYDLRFFDDLGSLHAAIRDQDSQHGLSRLVAGFAWAWTTKKDKSAFDITIGDVKLRWNQTDKDWINSSNAIDEVGSIHTVQGYDLNVAGVIIGADLGFDEKKQRIVFRRENYFDKKGMENNKKRGLEYSDEDILVLVRNIYAVLLTRGVRGTFVYVCDPELREYLAPFFTASPER